MKKLIITFLIIIQISLAIEKDFYKFKVLDTDMSYKTTERYENILNFSKVNTRLNLYSAHIDLEQYSNYSRIYLDLASGYLYLSDTWDLEYGIEKNFVTYQQKEEGDKDYNGWELDLLFRNYLHKFDWLGHRWSRSWGFGTSYSDGGNLDYDLFDKKVTDIFLTHRISTPFNLGLGGSYFTATTNAGGVVSTVPNNGYRLNLILSTSTKWGYGFTTYNSLNNELRSYGNYNNSYLLDFSTTTSWTYELSYNFAFITDLYFQSENFFGGTDRSNKLEFHIFPHIGYNVEVNDSIRIFSKLGITPVSIVKYSSGYDDSGLYAKFVLGVTYRW